MSTVTVTPSRLVALLSGGRPSRVGRHQIRQMTSGTQAPWHHLASPVPLIYQRRSVPTHKGRLGDTFTAWHSMERGRSYACKDKVRRLTPAASACVSSARKGRRCCPGDCGRSSRPGMGQAEPSTSQRPRPCQVSPSPPPPPPRLAPVAAIPEVYRYRYL